MKRIMSAGLLAVLGLALTCGNAEAFGRRKKANNNCCPAPVAVSPCGGCGAGYATVGGQGVYYTQSGQPGYYTGGAVAMPMPMAGTTGAVVGTTGTTTAGQTGMITILVPSEDAQVWFEDTALPQTGKQRTFKTPLLTDGKTYNYNIKAKWTNDSGKSVEKTLPVSVRAGQTSTVDFR